MLNFAYLAFFLTTFPFAMARNRLFGFYYAALYIYSAFSLVGYLYLPGLSESLSAYFGDDVGYDALRFVFASLAGFWVVNMLIYRPVAAPHATLLASHANEVTLFGTASFGAITLVFVGLLASNFSSLSWYIFEEAAELPFQTIFFLGMYKITVGTLVTGYIILRSPQIARNRIFFLIFIILALAFIATSIRLGNRTDPAAFLIGVVLYETLSRKLTVRTITLVGIGVLIAILGISAIEYFRYTDGGIQGPLLERIVRNDYYAPAHMLFAAIAFNFVDPLSVIQSNSANSLILLDQPYLQQTVTELFRTNIATRSAGYAFYIMAEGWIFAGWGGVIYNVIIPSAGLWLWNRIACTNDRLTNTLVVSLAACMLLNVTRGQSSYFIKYLYTFVLPNIGLAILLINLRFRLPGRSNVTVPRPIDGS